MKSTQDPTTIAEVEVGQVVTAIYCHTSLCKLSKPVLGYVLKKLLRPLAGRGRSLRATERQALLKARHLQRASSNA